jgi:hypothetical protein
MPDETRKVNCRAMVAFGAPESAVKTRLFLSASAVRVTKHVDGHNVGLYEQRGRE